MAGKKISKPSYYKAISELITKRFIAESSDAPGIFFINPSILFNGDCIRFIKEYQTSKKFEETAKKIKSIIAQQTIHISIGN
jgi:hypothetical protein